MALRDGCARLKFLSSVNVLIGAPGPRVDNHLLKSRFIPYLNTTEQLASFSLRPSTPEHVLHSKKLAAGSGSRMLGISAGSTIVAPSRLRTSIASAMSLAGSGLRPPRGVVSPGAVAWS